MKKVSELKVGTVFSNENSINPPLFFKAHDYNHDVYGERYADVYFNNDEIVILFEPSWEIK